ncbi:peptide/nickel transport system permease protein [Kaistia soli DSM 19436]|uniref:Peptide/nickel transport system permease protein n=1 Tax=Kaistia soli DSM 19436 TaxID=1122133 RepID=A0A1M5E2F6_9HYPH|nr:ABC transporter permease [Kaistia soli]SHF73251.1 peptide/nickel transport system permease protein [Kaistia soli DSM 19436]
MDGFAKYLARRFLQFILVIFLGVSLAFLITHLSPVDPVEQSVSLMTNFGATDPRSVALLREALSELYGLQGSFFEQYLAFWGRVLHGDFGPSLSSFPTPVMSLIMGALPWTVGLLTLSVLISWCLGNLLGALAGYFRSNLLLKLSGAAVMALHPVPAYIVGLLLLLTFGFVWPVLPISGGAQMNLQPGFSLAFVGSVIVHGLLPALTLVLVGIGSWFISMRSLVSNIVTDDHVVYAELGGVSSGTIFSQYVARNALLPQLTGLALSLGNVFGGAVITEFLFNYPGVGRLLIQGIYSGDYSLVLGVTTMSIVAVAVAVFVIDLLYPLIDPRVRLG